MLTVYIAIRIAKPKKSCPNVIIKVEPRNTAGDYFYVSKNKETSNIVHEFSFLQPSVHLTKYFEELNSPK